MLENGSRIGPYRVVRLLGKGGMAEVYDAEPSVPADSVTAAMDAEWVAVLVCSAMVLGAELFNTAIEAVVDLVSQDFNELAGKAKDVSAAVVWVIALFAAVVGIIVFGNAAMR